jgi:hypothetical protein
MIHEESGLCQESLSTRDWGIDAIGEGAETSEVHRFFTAKTAKLAKNIAKAIAILTHRTIECRNRR